MPVEEGSPADWMRFARSDLEVARGPLRNGVLAEALCFHAQQAVEKSLKALLLAHGIEFPYTHNLKTLISLLPTSVTMPPVLATASELTEYAVAVRYPGGYEPVTAAEHREAVGLAEAVVAWAEQMLGSGRA